MSEPKTIEEMIPNLIKFYIEEAEKLSESYGISKEAALNLMILIELNKIHTHIDRMVDVLQLIEVKKVE